ncbi:hypothetical protein F4818DRAFT_438564 [Hypoxylon cercidicola]|nr:hypothetical protein F4818DRAFT_438564 [Hypoxylon cercidicola]
MAPNITPLMWEEVESVRRKIRYARMLMKHDPTLWFGDSEVSPRDVELINAQPVDFLDFTLKEHFPHLHNVFYTNLDEETTSVVMDWTRDNDELCKAMVWHAGGSIFPLQQQPVSFLRVAERLQVQLNFHSGAHIPCDSGFLSCVPFRTRIFKGPIQTDQVDPWDAMILYDCGVSSEDLSYVENIATRKWDLLLMKLSDKDFTHPWIVVNMRDSGPAEDLGPEDEVPVD